MYVRFKLQPELYYNAGADSDFSIRALNAPKAAAGSPAPACSQDPEAEVGLPLVAGGRRRPGAPAIMMLGTWPAADLT